MTSIYDWLHMHLHARFSSCSLSSAPVKRCFDIGPCDSANRCILHQDAHVLGPYHSLPAGVILIDCSVTFCVHESRINMKAEPSMEPSQSSELVFATKHCCKNKQHHGKKIKSSSCWDFLGTRLDSLSCIPYQIAKRFLVISSDFRVIGNGSLWFG